MLLISFGKQDEAKVWSEEVCPPFRLLLNQERAVYRAYKLKRSWLRSWNLKTLAYYVRALRGGRDWRGIKGDSAQLGGDLIINPDRTFALAYRSRDAADRPKVSELLAISKN